MKNIMITLGFVLITSMLTAQIVNIPDPNFKNALVNTICVDIDHDGEYDVDVDTNNDGEIQVSEAEAIDNLAVSWQSISSMEGIEAFTQLESLYCSWNAITSLDLSQNLLLKKLLAYSNEIASIDLGSNTNITSLVVSENLLTTIDVSQNTSLIAIDLEHNLLTSIDLSQNTSLLGIGIYDNNLTSIDVSNSPDFYQLDCSDNPLTGTLDLSQNTALSWLICTNTQLTNINIKNGNNINILRMWAHDNPNLLCVQVDDVSYANAQYCDIAETTGWCKDETAMYSEDCNLGITEQSLQEAVQLYPNPVKNTLQISTQSQGFGSVIINKVTVYDVLGKLVLVEENPTSTMQLDVSNLASGLLLVKIETNKGFVVKKIVKE